MEGKVKSERRFVLDTGPFLLTLTEEIGSDKIRKLFEKHESGEVELFIHPNNLSEAYKVIGHLVNTRVGLLKRKIELRDIVRSAYSTLNVLQDEQTTANLGALRLKYRNKPWGDLSSSALALTLSANLEERVPVVVLEHEKHFADITEVDTLRVSQL